MQASTSHLLVIIVFLLLLSVQRRRLPLKEARIISRILPLAHHRLDPSSLALLLSVSSPSLGGRQHIPKQRPPPLHLWPLVLPLSLLLLQLNQPALALALLLTRRRRLCSLAIQLLEAFEFVAPPPLDAAVGSDRVDEVDRLLEPVEAAESGAARDEEEGLRVERLASFVEVGVGVLLWNSSSGSEKQQKESEDIPGCNSK